jgi:hypothetical protein
VKLPAVDDEPMRRIAQLLGERNAIDEEIAAITRRSMTSGHLGEWIAAQIQPMTEPVTSAHIAPELRITPGELVSFYTSAWQAATALVLTTGNQAEEVPPAGPSRLELYIQNRHPSGSGGERVLRTEDLVDLSVFGRSRKSQLRDLSVGVTAPLGLSAEEIGSLVRQALKQMASDFGFTAAETAQL